MARILGISPKGTRPNQISGLFCPHFRFWPLGQDLGDLSNRDPAGPKVGKHFTGWISITAPHVLRSRPW